MSFIHFSFEKLLTGLYIPSFIHSTTKKQCILLYYTGLLPFVRLDSDILGVPIDQGRKGGREGGMEGNLWPVIDPLFLFGTYRKKSVCNQQTGALISLFFTLTHAVDYARVREQKALKALPNAVCWVLAFVLGGKPPSALIPRGLFKHLRARGVPIFFLGVNDEEDLKVRKRGGCVEVVFACKFATMQDMVQFSHSFTRFPLTRFFPRFTGG